MKVRSPTGGSPNGYDRLSIFWNLLTLKSSRVRRVFSQESAQQRSS